MAPYICLCIYILILPVIVTLIARKNIENKSLLLSLLGVFLIMSLKSTSVGRDTPGYARMYNSFFGASWSNYNLYWTEWGYETLEMVFTHIFRFDFYQFAAAVYAFVCISYYSFWRRYSRDYSMSIFIYVCFGFLCMDLSAIRNMIALAIFLFALPYAEKKGYKNAVKYFALVIIAAQIHNSAYIGILFFFFIRFDFSKLVYLIAPVVTVLSRPVLAPIIKQVSNKDLASEMQIGGNVAFYIMVTLLPLAFVYVWKTQNGIKDSEEDYAMDMYVQSVKMPVRMVYLGVLLLLLAGESTFNRVAQFGLFFVTVTLPNALTPLESRSKFLMKTLVYVFLIWYFWKFKLSVNDLDMLPYVFNWK